MFSATYLSSRGDENASTDAATQFTEGKGVVLPGVCGLGVSVLKDLPGSEMRGRTHFAFAAMLGRRTEKLTFPIKLVVCS